MIASRAPEGLEPDGLNLWTIVAVQVIQAMLISPLINGLATFGEEFGWRAYLQPKLMPLGGRKAMLWMGLIWGVWHWPVIWMGHNYGLDYAGAPYLGSLAMVWFTLVLGIFLGWLTVKAGNVWPAVIGHAAINGMANLGAIFVQNAPNPLLGPAPVGLIGGLGFTLVALLIWFSPKALEQGVEPASESMVGAR
jgi:membrane protease YdiL (CAAX protease family)